MLSSLPFGSLLSYNPPRSIASPSGRFLKVRDDIKSGRVYTDGDLTISAYDLAARRIVELPADVLLQFFGPLGLLVPVPRSSPTRPGDFWPAEAICRAFVAAGLAGRAQPLVKRRHRVEKSSFAGRRRRPTPTEHYESFEAVDPEGPLPASITLVDDVVTKGATLIAAATRIAERLPGIPVTGFALLRTRGISPVEGASPLDPFVGQITMDPVTGLSDREDW